MESESVPDALISTAGVIIAPRISPAPGTSIRVISKAPSMSSIVVGLHATSDGTRRRLRSTTFSHETRHAITFLLAILAVPSIAFAQKKPRSNPAARTPTRTGPWR